MNDTKFNNAIGNIRAIRMTSAEKEAIRARVLAASIPADVPSLNRTSPVRSVWTVYSFGTWIRTHRPVTAALIVAVILLASGSAVSASYDALPGEILYTVKIGIREPIRVALASTDADKADIQAQLVQNRLQEAETLAARGALDAPKEEQINSLVASQISKLEETVDKMREVLPEKADDIQTTIDASMNAHTRLLNVLARGKDAPVIASARAALVSMAAPAPMMAAKSEVDSGRSAKSEGKDFEKKKTSVQSLIHATTIDLENASSSDAGSIISEVIRNDARENVRKAKDKLNEALSGADESQAYSTLLDSERSIKEAAIYLKAQTRLEKEVKREEISIPKDTSGSVKGAIDLKGRSGKGKSDRGK